MNYWVSLVGCKASSLPSSYLRLPLGSNMRRVSFWNIVLEKVKKHLSSWWRNFFPSGADQLLSCLF